MYFLRLLAFSIISIASLARSVVNANSLADCRSDVATLTLDQDWLNYQFSFFAQLMNCLAETMQGNECDDSGFSELQALCEGIDGADFFTYSMNVDCGDSGSADISDMPECLPLSCTSDEEVLKEIMLELRTETDYYDDVASRKKNRILVEEILMNKNKERKLDGAGEEECSDPVLSFGKLGPDSAGSHYSLIGSTLVMFVGAVLALLVV